MKKLTFLMCAILACLIQVNAQEPQFVTKDQQTRKVFIEEFTGRDCGYCPGGQATVNNVISKNPGEVFTVNIHASGWLSPNTYPNLTTPEGGEFFNAFSLSGIPAIVVNRSTAVASSVNTCASTTASLLKETAEVNVAGQVVINPATRTATITVEAYYTADSKSSTNYLTVMMLQDSILGSQNGASSNPAQVINGNYCHMHILRDIITPTWGEEFSPTTAGTLVTKTYVYEIPEVIGATNGVEVDLNNIEFIALVSEKKQGTPTRPILNVCKLEKVEGVDTPIYPYIRSVVQEDMITCSYDKEFTVEVANAGTSEITSMTFEIAVAGGKTTEYEWTGNLPVYGITKIDLTAEIPFGEHQVTFDIVKANGETYTFEKSLMANCEPWLSTGVADGATSAELKLELAQDRWGNQISWKVYASDDSVLASGGPYEVLSASGTKVHEIAFNIPAGECAMFVIEDNVGNGISGSSFGEGYYKLYDKLGNVLVESDGNYGFGEYHVIHIEGALDVEDVVETSYNVYPNPVKEVLTIAGENMKQINVINALGQVVKSVKCDNNIVKINVSDLQNGMYFVNVIDNNGEMTTSKVSVNK